MTPRRVKLILLVAGLAASAVTLLAWTQTWFSVVLVSGTALEVHGDVAAGALAALALSGIALTAALAIAGPVFRLILGVLEVAIGGLVIGSSAGALADPIAAVAVTVTNATAESGEESIRGLVSTVSATGWPGVALVAGVALALVGAAVLVTSRRWPNSSRRYQSVRFRDADAPADRSAVSAWDALSDGHDPT